MPLVNLPLLILRIYRMTSIDISFIRAFILFFQAYWQATGNRNVVIERAIHPRNMFDKIRTAIAFLLSSISFSLPFLSLPIIPSLSLSLSLSLTLSMSQNRNFSNSTHNGDHIRALNRSANQDKTT